jgi:hypothetical protein
MHDSTPPPGNTPAPGVGELSADGKGIWGLDLWNGSAWFSDWFVQRLKWTGAERKRLDDLRPHLPGGAWESLLAAIRNHLERQVPLELTVCATLSDGRIEWWYVQGVAEHNAGGQPVYLSGHMRDVSAENRRHRGGEEP